MLGTALLVTGLIFGLLRHEHRIWMAGLLIAVSLMTQFYNNASYRDFWNSQKQLWWQLTWRAPEIKDQTVLYALLPSSAQLAESYEIWGPANLIYRDPQQPLGIMGEILNIDTVLPLQQQAQYGRTFRRIPLNYDTHNGLVMSLIDPQTCLHVLDGQNLELSEKEDALIRLAAADSHIDRIVTSGVSKLPPSNIFGSEPPHTWCYYYEKASLARQAENWQEVARLGDEAKQLGFSPLDVSEWMPFYVGYAHVSRLDEVNGIGAILRGSPGFIDPYCFQKKQQPLPADRIDQFLVQNLCPEIK
jgi:hypothetical protein